MLVGEGQTSRDLRLAARKLAQLRTGDHGTAVGARAALNRRRRGRNGLDKCWLTEQVSRTCAAEDGTAGCWVDMSNLR